MTCHIRKQQEQVYAFQFQPQRAGLDQRQIENIVDQTAQRVAACHDGLHIFRCRGVQRSRHAGRQMLGKAQDRVQRRAKFIRHMLDEIGFEPVGCFQRIVAVAQRIFDAETVGDYRQR